jgi:hypothetical protein
MTLDNALLRLEGCFDAGQAYVALSRVRSLAGLYLEGRLGAGTVFADPAALDFCDKLSGGCGSLGGSQVGRENTAQTSVASLRFARAVSVPG